MSVVVSPSIKVLFSKLKSLVDAQTASTYNPQGVLKDIMSNLQYVSVVVYDVEEKIIYSKPLEDWLQRLQDMLYEADDMIDEVQIMSSNIYQIHPSNQVSFSLSRLQHIRQGLDVMARVAEVLIYDKLESVPTPQVSETYSHVNRSEVMGRGSDEEAVIDLIVKSVDEAERVSVVPIVGFIGVGKTALAQLIFNNLRIDDNFDVKLWVSLGQECRDIFLYRSILLSLGYVDYYLNGDRNVEDMKMKLHKSLNRRNFFVVLDGFEYNSSHTSLVKELTDIGSKGTAIILTTRSSRAASLIGTTPAYQLEALSFDASYQMFITYSGFDIQTHPECDPVASDLVKLCCGVPMILKMVGSLLYGEKTSNWFENLKTLRDRGLEYIIDNKRYPDVMFTIPSYLELPLQSFCLQACGLSVEAFICVWMALGFLYSDDPNQQPEHIARKYLKDFADSSLCPDVEYAPSGVVRRIKFNDALYAFVTFRSHQQWFITSDEVSHLQAIIFPYPNKGDTSDPAWTKRVRLYILCPGEQATAALVTGIVSDFNSLRVLGLGGCDPDMLPDSTGELKHLRYLDIGRNARIKRLPDSICNLWHLQTLYLDGCDQLEELPANIGSLQNLRYLTLTILLESLPEAIGQLTSLRTLELSSCPRLASLPSSTKYLKNLQTLAIIDCQELDLADSCSVEGLKGLDAIHTLTLCHLPKFESFPSDIENPSVEHLVIQHCTNLTGTTCINQFRFLRSLTFADCFNLVDLDGGFCELKKLERLEIRGCPLLTNWFESPAGKAWRQNLHVRVIELNGVRL